MTNYNKFPSWRAYYGITIKFNDHQYSWSDDTRNQRKYLQTSNYLEGAEAIYLGWTKRWFTVEEYIEFVKQDDYETQKSEAIKKYKSSK